MLLPCLCVDSLPHPPTSGLSTSPTRICCASGNTLQAGKDGAGGVSPDVAARLAAMQAQLDRLEALLRAATAQKAEPAASATS